TDRVVDAIARHRLVQRRNELLDLLGRDTRHDASQLLRCDGGRRRGRLSDQRGPLGLLCRVGLLFIVRDGPTVGGQGVEFERPEQVAGLLQTGLGGGGGCGVGVGGGGADAERGGEDGRGGDRGTETAQ